MSQQSSSGQQPPSSTATTTQPAQPAKPPKINYGALAQTLIGIFTAAIAGGIVGLVLALKVKAALLAAGVSAVIAAFIVAYAASSLPDRQSPFRPGPAERLVLAKIPFYRAWYIVNAVRRLEQAEATGDLDAAERREGTYFAWHLRAMRNRIDRAQQVDRAAKRLARKGLLGWKAMMDGRTTAECRAANGKNFRVDREPMIGWPGAVHPHCRCIPVAPFPGSPVIPSL